MTPCHYVIIIVSSRYFEFTSKLKQQKKTRKIEDFEESKIVSRLAKNVSRYGAHDEGHSTLVKTCHDGYFVTRF